MLLRTLLTFVNLVAIAVAIVVLLAFPRWDGPAFYLLIGWMFGSMVLVYGPWGNRQVGSARRTATPVPASPLPSGGTAPAATASPPTELGFCIYCAAPLPPGAPACAACGHRAAHL
jgi:hypothetical protein